MENKLKILLLEDSAVDADLLVRHLKKVNLIFDCTRVWTKNEFISEVKDNEPDLIIADQNLPQFTGTEAFSLLKKEKKSIPFILITGTVSEKLLIEYSKQGIDDYLLKENLLRMPAAIENVITKKKIERLNSELVETNSKLEKAYSDIRDSINYAKIIQRAMLPDEAFLEKYFPGSFVFFKPKDILSGDFFWSFKQGDTLYVAVADATGHGVPGALLAMMGNNLLNEIVNSGHLLSPAEILTRINKKVQHLLKSTITSLQDGMDIALCSIHLKTLFFQYCGANRPLIIERKQSIIKLNSSKKSIGGSSLSERHFENQTIQLESKDSIFMYSDGFVDQFSSITSKKLTNKRLIELIISSSTRPHEYQKDFFKDYFYEWMGDEEQTDDVLLMKIHIP